MGKRIRKVVYTTNNGVKRERFNVYIGDLLICAIPRRKKKHKKQEKLKKKLKKKR